MNKPKQIATNEWLNIYVTPRNAVSRLHCGCIHDHFEAFLSAMRCTRYSTTPHTIHDTNMCAKYHHDRIARVHRVFVVKPKNQLIVCLCADRRHNSRRPTAFKTYNCILLHVRMYRTSTSMIVLRMHILRTNMFR